MELIGRIFWFFTPYTDAREHAVGRFFKVLNEHKKPAKTRAKLDSLLQRNIAVINLWTEYRYKGYKNLRRSKRRKLYANLQLIADDFNHYYVNNSQSADTVLARIHRLKPQARLDPNRAILLQALMDYFSPMRGTFVYRETSSFGRLLRDPTKEKLVGDCNQIVTLYIYLYSRYSDVRDLQVRVLPAHVALHYGGVDIEATSGTFADYSKRKGARLLPIEEIVSINLLDATDAAISKRNVTAKDFLQAARFAFTLSHERDIVKHNLHVAYSRMIRSLMGRNNYKKALKFAKASEDIALLGIVGHNGAVHEMKHHNYKAARRFAQHAPERDKLINNIWHTNGIYHYQAQRYQDAIKAFKKIGDQTLIRKCYEGLFFMEQRKLAPSMTTASIKKYAGNIKRMRIYAKKSGNKKLIEHASSLNRHL